MGVITTTPEMLNALRRHLSNLATIGDHAFERLASTLEPRRLRKGDALLTPGDGCSSQAFVVSGCLRVYFTEDQGAQRVLFFAPEGWWASDFDSFESGAPSTLAIDAVEATEVLLVEKTTLDRLRASVPWIETLVSRLRLQMLARTQRRLVASLHKTAAQRYLEFLREYPMLAGRIPQYQIAAYVGISAEFLSTLRHREVALKALGA